MKKKTSPLLIHFPLDLRRELRRAAKENMLPESAIVRAGTRAEIRRLADAIRQEADGQASESRQEPCA